MKKLALIITLLFCILFTYSQTDLEIVNSLIGRPYSELEKIFGEYDLEYYVTSEVGSKANVYVSKNNSVRVWEIKHQDLFREKSVKGQKVYAPVGKDLVIEIFVRYRHSNLNDLREFHDYKIPDNTEHREYEKSYGEKLSHLRTTQK